MKQKEKIPGGPKGNTLLDTSLTRHAMILGHDYLLLGLTGLAALISQAPEPRFGWVALHAEMQTYDRDALASHVRGCAWR